MAWMFPLEIRGLGTPDVESMGSYIHRLADAHEISVRRMLSHCFDYYSRGIERPRLRYFVGVAKGSLAVYVRPNATTAYMVHVLERAVGTKLIRGTTFISLLEPLGGARAANGVFSHWMRWCPVCFAEFESAGDCGYFKLAWTVESVRNCPAHRVPLAEKCPKCSSKQGYYARKREVIRCEKCGASLGWYPVVNSSGRLLRPGGEDMLQLVEYISRNPDVTFREDGAIDVVLSLLDEAWPLREEDPLFRQFPTGLVTKLRNRTARLSITMVRRVGLRFGVDLVSMLSGDVRGTCRSLDLGDSRRAPADFAPSRKQMTPAKKIVLRRVHTLMKVNRRNPRPLSYYAAEARVSTGYLAYHFSVLAARISRTYKNWRSEAQESKRREARRAAFFMVSRSGGENFSKKQIFRAIRDETGLPQNVIREAINETFVRFQARKEPTRGAK